MYHLKIAELLKQRMTAHHLNLLIREAEKAVVNGEPAKVGLSPHELLALAGELIEHRKKYGPIERPPVYKPFSGARCMECRGTVIHYRGTRRMSHPASTCSCESGKETLGEPFDGQTPECNCGVSGGLRTDHEAECAMAYLHAPKDE